MQKQASAHARTCPSQQLVRRLHKITCYNIFLENPAKWYKGGPELYFTFKYMLNVGKPQGEVLPDSFPSSPTPTHHNPAL